MKYSIGEFADILGVTVDTLRLYEKYGIIRPIKDNKNNYRYFDDLDARNLLQSRWYRSMQIPLQDVAAIIKNPSLDNILEKIEETQKNLQEEIRKSTLLLNEITEISHGFKEIEQSLNKCRIKNIPGMYRIRQTDRNMLLKDDFLRDIVSTWMNILPYTFYSFEIEKREFLSGDDCFRYNWGLAIYEDKIHNFDVPINENVEYISPKICVSSVIFSSEGEYIMRDELDFMTDFINKNNYSIEGNIVGRIVITEKINGKDRSYLEVNIPIK
ncbi:HTH-type transcriptional activator TipA [Oxobacter pfennigii]|uniref:HTH-type transcriptional activator TipA n=1 Tax=Oxobacter pfennigii TaxID=36849 RepID=A0A0P8WCD4_9CLOT|nr:MerR family transcriptional regulator [Oxobacter pfennigii]KPU45553.1 HTH-type transcriptional activator TipA [Oxobacter pfennigii]